MIHSSYNPPDPKYRCMCGIFHVKTGTYIVCYATLACLILKTLAELISGYRLFPATFFSHALTAFVCGCAVYGVATEKSEFLIPYLFSLSVFLCMLILFFVIGLITLIVTPEEIIPYITSRNNWNDPIRRYDYSQQRGFDDYAEENTTGQVVLFFLIVLAGIAIYTWAYFIIYRCYQLFLAKTEASRLPTHQVPSFPKPSYPNVSENKNVFKEVLL